MRILVISDSHSKTESVNAAVSAQPSAHNILFLGDGEGDIFTASCRFPERSFYSVRGNCDFAGSEPDMRIVEIAGVRIFMTHGHLYGVKNSVDTFFNAVKRADATIGLFGHTHIPETAYRDGVYIMNPGTVSGKGTGERTYGIIDITGAGIVTSVISL